MWKIYWNFLKQIAAALWETLVIVAAVMGLAIFMRYIGKAAIFAFPLMVLFIGIGLWAWLRMRERKRKARGRDQPPR
jgi:hypothetical protein